MGYSNLKGATELSKKHKPDAGDGDQGDLARTEARWVEAVNFLRESLPYEHELRNAYRLAVAGEVETPFGRHPSSPAILRQGYAHLRSVHESMRAALDVARIYDQKLRLAQQAETKCPGCEACEAELQGGLYRAVQARLDTELPPAPADPDVWQPDSRALFAKWLVATGRLNEGLPRAGR